MRLLIDSVMVRSPGLIQLCRELSSAIAETAPDGCDVLLLTTPGVYEKSMLGQLTVVALNSPAGGWIGRWYWYNVMLPKIARHYNADVLYSLSGILSESLYKSLGVVNSVNNMVPFEPTMMGKDCSFFSDVYLRNFVLRHIYTSSSKIADAVVLHSRHALNMITKYTGDISTKVFVVLTGVPYDVRNWSVDLRPHPNGGAPYFLYLSVIRSYKNHLRLVEAYHQALKVESNLPDLLLAGIPEEQDCLDKIIAAIKTNDLEKRIKYLGVLTRDYIPDWLYYADINLFPSLCETNSVVLSEIMGLGGVLACSGIPPLSEIVEYAGEYFDPYSVDSIAATMVHLFRNEERCKDLRRLSLKRSAEFSWSNCGKVIWQATRMADTAFQLRKR